MKPTNLALALAVAPAAAGFSMLSPYRFPRMQTLFKEMDEMFERDWPSTFMEEHLDQMDQQMKEMNKGLTLRRSSPRYELAESPDKFMVTIEVPEAFKLEDIDVDLKAEGRMLSISGQHEEKNDDSSFSSKFQQNFALDPTVEINNLTANFHDGKLVISAPRKPELPRLEDRKIDVTTHALEGKKEVPIVEDEVQEEAKVAP